MGGHCVLSSDMGGHCVLSSDMGDHCVLSSDMGGHCVLSSDMGGHCVWVSCSLGAVTVCLAQSHSVLCPQLHCGSLRTLLKVRDTRTLRSRSSAVSARHLAEEWDGS